MRLRVLPLRGPAPRVTRGWEPGSSCRLLHVEHSRTFRLPGLTRVHHEITVVHHECPATRTATSAFSRAFWSAGRAASLTPSSSVLAGRPAVDLRGVPASGAGARRALHRAGVQAHQRVLTWLPTMAKHSSPGSPINQLGVPAWCRSTRPTGRAVDSRTAQLRCGPCGRAPALVPPSRRHRHRLVWTGAGDRGLAARRRAGGDQRPDRRLWTSTPWSSRPARPARRKGVMSSYAHSASTMAVSAPFLRADDDRYMVNLPLFHSGGVMPRDGDAAAGRLDRHGRRLRDRELLADGSAARYHQLHSARRHGRRSCSSSRRGRRPRSSVLRTCYLCAAERDGAAVRRTLRRRASTRCST